MRSGAMLCKMRSGMDARCGSIHQQWGEDRCGRVGYPTQQNGGRKTENGLGLPNSVQQRTRERERDRDRERAHNTDVDVLGEEMKAGSFREGRA